MVTTREADHTRARALWVLRQVGLVVVAVFLYFRVRGLTEASSTVAVKHARDIVSLEQHLGINVEQRLQAPVAESDTATTVANWIYIWGHWPVIIATMVWLVCRHRDAFLRLRDGMLVSGALGIVIFATYPVSPPRLAGFGLVDTVTERSTAYRVLQPPALVNQYAAMPSLHLGWDLLVGIAIVTTATRVGLKVIGLVLPVLMAIAVIVTANHYVLDVVAGLILVLLGHAAALALERRRGVKSRPPSDLTDARGPREHRPAGDQTALRHPTRL
jgi:hypothetical protein